MFTFDIIIPLTLGDREKVVRGVQIFLCFLVFFFIDEGIEDPNTAINGPLKWCFAGRPIMAQL